MRNTQRRNHMRKVRMHRLMNWRNHMRNIMLHRLLNWMIKLRTSMKRNRRRRAKLG